MVHQFFPTPQFSIIKRQHPNCRGTFSPSPRQCLTALDTLLREGIAAATMIAMMDAATTTATTTATATAMTMDAIAAMTVAHLPHEVLAVAVTRTGPSHTRIVRPSTTRRAISLLPQTTRSLRRRLVLSLETAITALHRATSPSGSTSLQVYKSRMTRIVPTANSLDRMARHSCPPVLLLRDLCTDPSQQATDVVGVVVVVAEAAVMPDSRLPTDPC